MRCTCGHPDDYNYAIDNGLCNSCIAEKLDQLEDENEQLRKELEEIALMGNTLSCKKAEQFLKENKP